MSDFIAIVAGVGIWILIGNAIGGVIGFLIGGACGFVAFIIAGFVAMDKEQSAEARAKQKHNQEQDDHYRNQYPEEDPGPITRGKCPDCGYEPISTSCIACPKCGCRSFIRILRGRRMAECSDCGGVSSYGCESCHGAGRIVLIQAVDFRSGAVLWETSRSLSIRQGSSNE